VNKLTSNRRTVFLVTENGEQEQEQAGHGLSRFRYYSRPPRFLKYTTLDVTVIVYLHDITALRYLTCAIRHLNHDASGFQYEASNRSFHLVRQRTSTPDERVETLSSEEALYIPAHL
jgi:hypothetical protein